MEQEIQEVVTFRSRHEAVLRQVHRRANAELGFELPFDVFAVRVYEACELVFGDRQLDSETATGFISALHTSDLYLAAAATEGNSTAVACLRRWFRPAISDYSEQLDRAQLADELLERRGPTAPLAAYVGLSPLEGWLRAVIARASATTLPIQRLTDLFAEVPDIRRAIDRGPARAFGACSLDERMVLLLSCLLDISDEAAARLIGRSPRAWRSFVAGTIRNGAQEITRMLEEAGIAPVSRSRI